GVWSATECTFCRTATRASAGTPASGSTPARTSASASVGGLRRLHLIWHHRRRWAGGGFARLLWFGATRFLIWFWTVFTRPWFWSTTSGRLWASATFLTHTLLGGEGVVTWTRCSTAGTRSWRGCVLFGLERIIARTGRSWFRARLWT